MAFKAFKLFMVFALAAALFWGASPNLLSSDCRDDKFKPGQVWEVKNRNSQENCYVKILKVERYRNAGVVVHISVSNIKLTDSEHKDIIFTGINHIAYGKKALEDSVTKLVEEDTEIPDFQAEYQDWRTAFDRGMAGIWELPLANGLNIVEEIGN